MVSSTLLNNSDSRSIRRVVVVGHQPYCLPDPEWIESTFLRNRVDSVLTQSCQSIRLPNCSLCPIPLGRVCEQSCLNPLKSTPTIFTKGGHAVSSGKLTAKWPKYAQYLLLILKKPEIKI